MTAPYFATGRALARRSFLRASGVALALPLLDSMRPAFARSPKPADAPRRFLGVCNNLGLLPDHFFPAKGGRDYEPSTYLKLLAKHRKDFTVFSGVSHPDVDGGHPADICFLTAAPHPSSGGFRNTISLDQYVAERIGVRTRFPSITLGVNTNGGTRSLSWTGSGVPIPCEEKPSAVFRRMFTQGTAAEVQAQVKKLEQGQSILDAVAGQAKDLKATLPARDRDRLDQYFDSVRDLEGRLATGKEWELKPKPKAPAAAPTDVSAPAAYMEKTRLMYDMARLAFETDSTRCVTLMLDSVSSPVLTIEGETITEAYHNLSHHGKSAAKLAQLKAIDEWHMRLLSGLFDGLKSATEDGAALLDRTMVLYGSNLGNAATHVTTNMPVLLAGGGFKHAGHLAFDRERNYPLPNLFVSMLQRLGLPADKFASSTGTLRGLDAAG
jgi:BMFP domain-containing protein YqiC